MAEENKILRLVYTFFLGLILAIFIGVGTSTFYPSPERPEYPTELNSYGKEMTEEQIARQVEFDNKMVEFDKDKMNPYNRNVSMITLSAAVILLALSMFIEKKKIHIIADGAMLGGLFTLFYSLGRGFASQNSKYSFIIVSIGLCVVVYLGYRKFAVEHALISEKKQNK